MSALVALCSLAILAAGDVTVRAELDPPEIPYHLQSRLSVIVEAPEDIDVSLPEMSNRVGELDVVDMSASADTLPDGRRQVVESYVLEGFLKAEESEKNFTIEPITVTWGDGQDITIPSLTLRLRELTEDERAAAEVFIDDIDPMEIPTSTSRDWRAWLLGIASLVAVAAIAYFIVRRLRRPVVIVPKTAWDLAYERMNELDRRQLPQKGAYDEYYVVLSRIIRVYIEDRFHIHAPEQTTPEFLADASASGNVSAEHEAMLARFLHRCDRVKFAKYTPSVPGMEGDFTEMLRFIDETVPKEEPEPEKEAAA